MTEASAYTYQYGFNDCKAKAADLFPGLDLTKIVLQEEKVAEEGEIRKEITTKEVPIEEVTSPTILEEPIAKDIVPLVTEKIHHAPLAPKENV